MTRDLTSEYRTRKKKIKERLKEFKAVWRQGDKRIFSELCFCICTPQSKAVSCDKAVSALEKNGLLFRGDRGRIRSALKAVRFPNNKARYIVECRRSFTDAGAIRIKKRLDTGDIRKTREWLVRNVKGIGFKEASHFLRNIGFGDDLAILDVHILRNMVACGIIKELPGSTSASGYLFLEDKLRKFAKKINIPMAELDLLFWAAETGHVFK